MASLFLPRTLSASDIITDDDDDGNNKNKSNDSEFIPFLLLNQSIEVTVEQLEQLKNHEDDNDNDSDEDFHSSSRSTDDDDDDDDGNEEDEEEDAKKKKKSRKMTTKTKTKTKSTMTTTTTTTIKKQMNKARIGRHHNGKTKEDFASHEEWIVYREYRERNNTSAVKSRLQKSQRVNKALERYEKLEKENAGLRRHIKILEELLLKK